MMALAQSSPPSSFTWVTSSGTVVVLNAAQLQMIFAAAAAFIQATFATLAGVIAGINAGSITTQSAVDVPPSSVPAWPANS
jgi:hypothetical protein